MAPDNQLDCNKDATQWSTKHDVRRAARRLELRRKPVRADYSAAPEHALRRHSPRLGGTASGEMVRHAEPGLDTAQIITPGQIKLRLELSILRLELCLP
jgi:hypothetical protein